MVRQSSLQNKPKNNMNTTNDTFTLPAYYSLYSAERYCSGRISGYRLISGVYAGYLFKTKSEMLAFAKTNGFGVKRNAGNLHLYSV